MNVNIIKGFVVECCESTLWFDYSQSAEAIAHCVSINRDESSQRCRHTHSVFAASMVTQCDGYIEDVLPTVALPFVRIARDGGVVRKVIVDCPAEWNAEVVAFRDAEAAMIDAMYADDCE